MSALPAACLQAFATSFDETHARVQQRFRQDQAGVLKTKNPARPGF
jgi:hypothetical protein